MARKTIKGLEEVIKDLEERLKVQTEANSKLVNDMGAMQEKADNSFLNSALHKQLLRVNRMLKATIESKDRIIKQLEKNNTEFKIENSRLNADIVHVIADKNNLSIELDKVNKIIEQDNKFYKDNETIKNKLNETLILSTQKTSKILKLEEEIEQLKNNIVQKIKNERGGGRKPKINDVIIDQVKELRLQGKSIRAIALDVNLSVGSVQKIVNEHLRRG